MNAISYGVYQFGIFETMNCLDKYVYNSGIIIKEAGFIRLFNYDRLFFDWDKIDDEKLGFGFCYLLYFLPSFTDSMASLCHCESKWWKLFCPVSYC